MHNKRNVIVMFLLIMLSFAIITEVSAASDAEINGTGSNPPMMSDMTDHDISSERDGESHANDFQSHNGQNSFNKTPMDVGDNKSNEILYEHDADLKSRQNPLDLNRFDEFKSGDDMPLDFNRSMFGDKPMGDLNFTQDLRNGSFTDARKDGELMDDVVSKLIGLSNIAPTFNNDDRNNSSDKKPMGDNVNGSAPMPGDKNPSDMKEDKTGKSKKALKVDKKSKKKAKPVKKSVKKVKSKKPKKAKAKLPKKSKKERAKL